MVLISPYITFGTTVSPIMEIGSITTGSDTALLYFVGGDVSSDMALIWRRLHAAYVFVHGRARRR